MFSEHDMLQGRQEGEKCITYGMKYILVDTKVSTNNFKK
jgi:hypothetical protein